MSRPVYRCDNDDCNRNGQPVLLDRDGEAVCPACGWMLVGNDQ